MLIALSMLALVLTLGLSAYFLYRVSCDIRYNLGLVVDRLDTMNECNDHALETQCNAHLDYVQWRKEDVERQRLMDTMREMEHICIMRNQLAQPPKRSHHKKAVQEQEPEQATEQVSTSMVSSESEL